MAVFNPQQALWSIAEDAAGTKMVRYSFGSPGDVPVVGNWAVGGSAQSPDRIGVFNQGLWSIDVNGDGQWGSGDTRYTFGNPGDIPVVGDWNADGLDDLGVFNPNLGQWSLDLNGNGQWDEGIDQHFTFGGANDVPVVYGR